MVLVIAFVIFVDQEYNRTTNYMLEDRYRNLYSMNLQEGSHLFKPGQVLAITSNIACDTIFEPNNKNPTKICELSAVSSIKIIEP